MADKKDTQKEVKPSKIPIKKLIKDASTSTSKRNADKKSLRIDKLAN